MHLIKSKHNVTEVIIFSKNVHICGGKTLVVEKCKKALISPY